MAKLKLHAGDWQGTGEFIVSEFKLPRPGTVWSFDRVNGLQLAEVELASEESVKRIGGTVGWGIAGAVVLGPVGLLAGLLLGGKGQDVTFVAKFKDGRRMLATTDSKTFTKIRSYVF
jgi:hypothetical protein